LVSLDTSPTPHRMLSKKSKKKLFLKAFF
jgi:hypothetical protein